MSEHQQTTPPGTEAVIGTFECGHGRTHQAPSSDVRVFRSGGAGFVGYCTCEQGSKTIEDAEDRPHVLGSHVTLLGGTALEPALWLALEAIAEDGWDHEGAGGEFGEKPYTERREDLKAEHERRVRG